MSRPSRPSALTSLLLGGTGILIVGVWSFFASAFNQKATEPLETHSLPVLRDDAEKLVEKCGKPDADKVEIKKTKGAQTQVRVMIYKRQRVVARFVQELGVAQGVNGKWIFEALYDPSSQGKLGPAQTKKRFGCWADSVPIPVPHRR